MEIWEVTYEDEEFQKELVADNEKGDPHNTLEAYLRSIPHSEVGKIYCVDGKWCVLKIGSLDGMKILSFPNLQEAYATVQTDSFIHKITDFTYQNFDDDSWVVYGELADACDLDRWTCISRRVPEEWYQENDDKQMTEFSSQFWEYISEVYDYYVEFDDLDASIEVLPYPPHPSVPIDVEQEIADRIRDQTMYGEPDWPSVILQIGKTKVDPDFWWYPESIDDIE